MVPISDYRGLLAPSTADRVGLLTLDFEIFHRRPAAIRDLFVLNDLTLTQASQAGLLDSRDVNEYVSPASLWPDETETLSRIEPLHRAARHCWPPTVHERKSPARGGASNAHLEMDTL
jgi:hypothetical protein